MSGDEILKVVFGVILTAIVAAVGWLVNKVLTNREGVKVLEVKVEGLEKEQLTQECVRIVIDESLKKRDLIAQERREVWDEKLTTQIKLAVMEGVNECQAQTREELDKLIPRIIDEVFRRMQDT